MGRHNLTDDGSLGSSTVDFDPRNKRMMVQLMVNGSGTTDRIAEFARALDREVESRKATSLQFDLGNQMLVSSSVVNLLLRYTRRGMDVHLLDPSEDVIRVLERTRLLPLFQILRSA